MAEHPSPAPAVSRRLVSRRDAVVLIGLLSLGVLLLGMTEALRLYGSEPLLGEWGAIELTQLGLLGATGCALGRWVKRPSMRPVAVPLLLLLGAVMLRELDAALDRFVHGSWKYPAWALALSAAEFLRRNRAAAIDSIAWLRGQRTMGLFACSAFVVLVQSRLIGRQIVWESALADGYLVAVPRLVEELIELVGYGILLLASLDIPASAAESNMCREPSGRFGD